MKHQPNEITGNRHGLVRMISKFGMAAALAALIGLGAATATAQAVDPEVDDQGAQVLTRGPVHEAFAGIVTYNPEPGVIVEKAPPEAIEEIPPELRPAGDNISWIPGYWAWDDERSDYLWISGTWRALPPGRQWTTGYWATVSQGYQWISGYWADASVEETTYLPKPPVTVESGPNVKAPSKDHAWTPGTWMWNQERYAWRPGYWAEGRSDWDWIPANYVWTPRGYVFVDGYWDYNFDRRGVVYAPVYFQSSHYSRPGYSYSPVVAIGVAAMMEHLFVRPNYHHYYFGDYYNRRYRDNGYYSPSAYQSSRHGYDPVYSNRRWTHRQERDWESRYEASYDYRRDHESARPPRTWMDQKRLRLDTPESREQRLLMATPFDQMARQKEKPMRTERVAANERQKLTDLSREVRKTREERKVLESEGRSTASERNEREIKPSKVKRLASPIVGRSPDRFEKNQAPPKPQNSPNVDPNRETPDLNPDAEKSRPETKGKPEPRDGGFKRDQLTPRGKAVPKTQNPQPKPERGAENSPGEAPQAKQPKPERGAENSPREAPQAKQPKPERGAENSPREAPQAKQPKPERRAEPPREAPQAKQPKPERRAEPPREAPQAKQPKPERRAENPPREAPQAKQPKPERRAENPPRQAPQVKEPKRETRPEIRQPERKAPVKPREESKPRETVERKKEASKPPSRNPSEPDKEDSGPSTGKDQKKERR